MFGTVGPKAADGAAGWLGASVQGARPGNEKHSRRWTAATNKKSVKRQKMFDG